MKAVPKQHLLKRGDIWHYQRRVPRELVARIGRTVIKRSFGTADLKQAKKLRDLRRRKDHGPVRPGRSQYRSLDLD
jgi:hypothetical protein